MFPEVSELSDQEKLHGILGTGNMLRLVRVGAAVADPVKRPKVQSCGGLRTRDAVASIDM